MADREQDRINPKEIAGQVSNGEETDAYISRVLLQELRGLKAKTGQTIRGQIIEVSGADVLKPIGTVTAEVKLVDSTSDKIIDVSSKDANESVTALIIWRNKQLKKVA